MLDAGWTEIIALGGGVRDRGTGHASGISGAVLLLPFQVSVLGTPSPAVTRTNLLYSMVATPGALHSYWRQGQAGGRRALVLIAGPCPMSSPDRSSAPNCGPGLASSALSSPRFCCRLVSGRLSPGPPARTSPPAQHG